jgi:PKHD-type hydroxylase
LNSDYVYLRGRYSSSELSTLRTLIKGLPDIGVGDQPADVITKTASVKCFNYFQAQHLLEKFHNTVLDLNKEYFGFNLFETSHYEVLNYNTYDESNQGEYDWHKDGVKNRPFDIKLTALLNLSEGNYTGGKFELFLNGSKEIVEFGVPGTILVFPSWIVHRVTPVTQGQRITLTKFYTGPNLQ